MPSTLKTRPLCFPLPFPLDKERLLEDLENALAFNWLPEEPFGYQDFPGSAVTTFHDGQWKGLGLRTQGGEPCRTDPGGPGLMPFMDTPVLGVTPYFREIINRFRCTTRSIRLSMLPSKVNIEQHCDTYHDFRYGQIRLHIPILTNPEVNVQFRDQPNYWEAGALWYGDFSQPHLVENPSARDRVHLMVDFTINDWVLSLFPDPFVEDVKSRGIVWHEEPVELPPEVLQEYECDFVLSAPMMKGIFETDEGIPGQFQGTIRLIQDELILSVGPRKMIALYPVGENRFCFVGWCSERCLEIETRSGRVAELSLVIRHGHYQTKILLPLAEETVNSGT